MADLLGTLREGLRAFATDTPIEEVRATKRADERGRRTAALLEQLGQSEAPLRSRELRELIAVNPQAGQTAADAYLGLDEARQTAMINDSLMVRAFLETNQPDRALKVIESRTSAGQGMGADMSETMLVGDLIRDGKEEEALTEINSFLDVARAQGKLPKDAAAKSYQPQLIESVDEEGNKTKKMVVTLVDPVTQEVTAKEVPLPEGFEFAKETLEEKLLAEQQAKRRQSADARKQDFIDRGVLAAESMANLKRALYLLDKVETGGPDAWAQAIKQFFGVEGADAGELSANMGKAVLKQLKSTFGAAFTQAEGDRLTRLEAGFGRNNAVNRRLLNNALAIADRAARRGLNAAKSMGDDFAVEDIETNMAFELNPDEFQPTPKVDTNIATDEELTAREQELEQRAAQ